MEGLKKEFEAIQKPVSDPVQNPDREFHVGDKVIHFKWELNRERRTQGFIYEITGFPMNTETGEVFTAYHSVTTTEKAWIRPYTDFVSEVDHAKYPDVKQKYRFVKVN